MSQQWCGRCRTRRGKKAEKEKLEELENEVDELLNTSRRNNLVYYHVPEKAEGQECADFVQGFIATHMGLETLCVHVEIERAHRTPTRRAKNSDKEKPRPIHVAFLRYTDKRRCYFRLKDNPFQGKRTQERRKELVPYKKKSIEETRAKRKAFIAYPGREW